jgi:ketosteroid isomerase-like protein
MVRFPGAFRALTAAVFRSLKPSSRLRRVLLRRALIAAWAAVSRGDYELRSLFFAPDVESELPAAMQTLGLGGELHSTAAMEDALSEWRESWGGLEFEPAYILDLGDRLLNLGFIRARGQASGVQLDQELAQLATFRNGQAVRDQSWMLWEEGIRAAGLDPGGLALPRERTTAEAR